MSQLRILTDNAADRATITVAGTASGMGADKLKTDIKGQVCRVLSGTAQIILTWAEVEQMGAVVIPAHNLGPSSTIRVRGYTDEAGTIQVYDSTVLYAASGGTLINYGFDQPLNVNQFAFGPPPCTAVYPDQQVAVRRVVINLEDPDATFIDMSRLLVGATISPAVGASYGQSDGTTDLSVNSRTASGDLKTDAGPRAKRMTFNLDFVEATDRSRIKRILDRGIGKFIWVSLMSGDEDPELERDKSIYGKLAQSPAMQWVNFSLHGAPFEIEGF